MQANTSQPVAVLSLFDKFYLNGSTPRGPRPSDDRVNIEAFYLF